MAHDHDAADGAKGIENLKSTLGCAARFWPKNVLMYTNQPLVRRNDFSLEINVRKAGILLQCSIKNL